jgi:hypothetical protein
MGQRLHQMFILLDIVSPKITKDLQLFQAVRIKISFTVKPYSEGAENR